MNRDSYMSSLLLVGFFVCLFSFLISLARIISAIFYRLPEKDILVLFLVFGGKYLVFIMKSDVSLGNFIDATYRFAEFPLYS